MSTYENYSETYCSNDGANTWAQRVTPKMNTAVYALAADPTNFNVMYAGVNSGPCSNPPPVCQPKTYFIRDFPDQVDFPKHVTSGLPSWAFLILGPSVDPSSGTRLTSTEIRSQTQG